MATALDDRRRMSRVERSVAMRAETPSADERPLWQTVAILYSTIAFLAVFLIAVCYLAAYLATGRAY
jgi:hypothetical protein